MSHRPAVRVTGLRVEYGPVVALHDVTFELAAGTSAALIGPNGSGKTTLLHSLAGLARPTAGTVDLAGDGTVAYVLQHPGERSWMPISVAEVVRMGRYAGRGLLGRLGRDDRDACREAMERMEVTDLASRQFGELSGGQRQRVLVAQALARRAALLLLDEPVTGLDLASQQRILDVLDEERAAGTTVVISTHHLDEARHCDLVLLLAGRLVAQGSPEEVLTEAHLREAYAGRLLGGHEHHAHAQDLLLLDDHGHGVGEH